MHKNSRRQPPKRMLFKPAQADPGTYLDARRDLVDLLSYADAYHHAGRKLAAAPRQGGLLRDLEALPILFLYRHALELYLKSLVVFGTWLHEAKGLHSRPFDTLLKSHRLAACLPELKRLSEDAGWGWATSDESLRSFTDLERCVNDLDKVDQLSYAFRYPVDKHGSPSLQNNLPFSLPHFCAEMDHVLSALHEIALGLDLAAHYEGEARFFELRNRGDHEANPQRNPTAQKTGGGFAEVVRPSTSPCLLFRKKTSMP